MIVILAVVIQVILIVLLGLFNFVFRRNKLIEYCYNSIFLVTRYIMGCKLIANPFQLKDKVLLISNHPTVLDFIYILHWAKLNNRVEDLRFISKESIGNIPFIGKYIKESQCLISKDFDTDYEKIISFCKKLSDQKSYLLIIFPEGTTICPETKDKSLHFSKNNYKPIFNKLLYPRHRGLELILKHLLIQQFVDITLFYNDDRSCYKCNYEHDILFDSYPKNGVILAKEIPLHKVSVKTISNILEKIWIRKEKFLKGIQPIDIEPSL